MAIPERSWTVLVVDDSQEFLDTVSAWMSARPEFQVVGTALDGAGAMECIESLQPDLVLMDAVMPVLDGFEATRRLRAKGDMRRIVIVSFHDSEAARQEAWIAGADGFVSKAEFVRSLPRIVHGFATGAGDRDRKVAGGRGEGRRPSRPRQDTPEEFIERNTETRPGIGAFLRRLFSFDIARGQAGNEPAFEISGTCGGSDCGPPDRQNTEG
jgi:DNA-binding NarL/FixJ family response regulator